MFIDKFINFLRFEKRFSIHTIDAYQRDLSEFQKFSSKAEPEVTHRDIRRWILDMVDRGHEAASVNRKISALRSYYRFLQREGLVTLNPTVHVQALKTAKRLPVVAREGALNAALDAMSHAGSDFAAIRDHCLLEMLYCTGMRRSEVISLKESDVDLYTQQVTVIGKRNKQRIIPLTRPMVALLKVYLEAKSSAGFRNNSGSLFVTDKGVGLYPDFVYRVVKVRLGEAAGVKSPHVLRHSFATSMLEAGADLNAIKELLGHSSLAATQVYTHNSVSKLKAVYKQAHPKA